MCLRTESQPTDKTSETLKSLMIPVAELIRSISKIGSKADKIKRMAFYGQASPSKQKVTYANFEGVMDCFDSLCDDKQFARLIHAVLGIMSELGEIATELGDSIQAKRNPNVVNLLEEFGDVGWYIPVGCDALGSSLEDVQCAIVAKLAKRYGDTSKANPTFTEARAAKRDLEGENELLKSRLDPATGKGIRFPDGPDGEP